MRVLERSATRWSKRARTLTATGLFVVAAVIAPFTYGQVTQAAGENLSAVANKIGVLGEDVAIADLQVTGTGDESISVTLTAPNGDLIVSDESAVIAGSGTNVLTLQGLRSEVNSTLSSLVYRSEGLGSVTIKVDYGNNVGNVIFNDSEGGNGHAYIVVNNPLPWVDAAAAAQTYTFGGETGYLATITDSQENDFVYNALNQQTGWIGANDIASEGAWGWRVGPEAGTEFWSGNFEGSSVDGEYNNWADEEPNNSSGNEDCAQFWNEGFWNDLNCATPRPYVVEFGGDGPLEPVQTTFIVTTVREEISVSTCEQLFGLDSDKNNVNITLTQDIDCAGQSVTPLFRDNFFRGNFNGAGYAISNFVVSESIEDFDEYAGLFGGVEDGSIQNLTIQNATVSGQDRVGVLVGQVGGSITVENVHVKNSTVNAASGFGDSGADDIGGLIGSISISGGESIYITKTSFKGKINVVDGSSVGGLIGGIDAYENSVQDAIFIEKSFADAVIKAGSNVDESGFSEHVGGLIGQIEAVAYGADFNVVIRDVYSWSSIAPATNESVIFGAGGLVGKVYTEATELDAAIVHIERAYANGSVEATGVAGGLIGFAEHDAYSPEGGSLRISNSFAAGKVSVADAFAGALIGMSDAESAWNNTPYHIDVSSTYFDQMRTGQSVCAPDAVLAECYAVNTNGSQASYFINNTSNAPFDVWNFSTTWVANTHVMPTFTAVVERDGDGVSDEEEMGAPNNGDGNNDGIPDVAQPNVTSLVDPVSDKYVTLVVNPSCDLSDVFTTNASSHEVGDAQYSYSTGFVNFTASGCDGNSTDVQLYYHGVDASGLVARKFNPNTNTYFTISSATLNAAASPLSGTVVSYTVVDNGELDINPTSGVITDPVGLASVTGAPNTGFNGQNSIVLYVALGVAGAGLLAGVVIVFRKQLGSLFTNKK